MKSFFKFLSLLIVSTALISCGGSEKKETKPSAETKVGKDEFEPEAYGKKEEDEEVVQTPKSMDPETLADNLEKALKNNQIREVPEIAAKILSRDESNVPALNALGVYNYKLNKLGIASIFWNRVLKKDNRNSQALNNLGVIAAQESNDSDAITLFKKAIKFDSDNTAAYANLGALYLKYYNFKAAEATLDLAYRDSKKTPAFLNNYSLALYGAGSSSKALDRIEEAISKSPKNVSLAANYASILVHQGKDLVKAEKLLTKLKLLTQDPKMLVRLSRINKELKRKVAERASSKKGAVK